jgi:DNA-binding response OmpR family regulator
VPSLPYRVPECTAGLATRRLLALDPGVRVVQRVPEVLPLTTVEFDLLGVFLRMAGQVVRREALVQDVLGRAFSPFDRSIDVHVSNLRRKLGPHPDGSERIKGVRGIGYLYAVPRRRWDRGLRP